MMSFSTAGSQVGGDSGAPSPQPQTQQLQPLQPDPTGHVSPLMTPQMGMGFDPRMSMMGMGMMSPGPMGWGDPRMSMFGGGQMDYSQMQGFPMQSPPPQSVPMQGGAAPYGNPSRSPSFDPPNVAAGHHTPPPRGSGNASPRPPPPPPPPAS
jgi:CCR4-NOT transcriptional complex subunit CAF120